MRKLKLTYTPKQGRLDRVWCWVNTRLKIATTAAKKIEIEVSVRKNPSIIVIKVTGGESATFGFTIHEGKKKLYYKVHKLDEYGEFRHEISV